MTSSTIQNTIGNFKKTLTLYREKNKQQKKWIKNTDYLKMLDKQNPEKMVESLYSNFSKKNDDLLNQFTELSNKLSDNLKKSNNKDYQKFSKIFGLFASLGNINEQQQQQQQYQLKIMKKMFKNEKQRTLLDKFINQIGKIHEKNKEKISKEELFKKIFAQQDKEMKKEYMELLKKDNEAYRKRCNEMINTYKWERYYQFRHAFLGLFVFGMVLLLFWYFQSSTKFVFKDIKSMLTYFQNVSKDISENKFTISDNFNITSSSQKTTAININPSQVFDNLSQSPVESNEGSSILTSLNKGVGDSVSNLFSSASGVVSSTTKALNEIDIEKMINSAKKTTTDDIGIAFYQGGRALSKKTFQTGKKGSTAIYQTGKYFTDKAYQGSKALGDKVSQFSGKIMDTTSIVKEQLQLVLLEQMNKSMNVIIQILEYFQTINKLGSQVWNFLIFIIGLSVASFLYCCITIEKLVFFNIIRIQRGGNQKSMDYDLLRQCLKLYM